jgi:hypothetical protein
VYIWNGTGRYEGEWIEGKKHGRGWRQWSSTRDEYNGEWKSDEICGTGTMTCVLLLSPSFFFLSASFSYLFT